MLTIEAQFVALLCNIIDMIFKAGFCFKFRDCWQGNEAFLCLIAFCNLDSFKNALHASSKLGAINHRQGERHKDVDDVVMTFFLFLLGGIHNFRCWQ